jgi:predicted transcriptional regulator
LIAVFPQPNQSGREYLEQAHIVVDDVRQRPATDLRVRGTPTLVLVDRNGTVKNKWEGVLSPEQEAEVMTLLQTKPKASAVTN